LLPDKSTLRGELDEVVRLPGAVSLALVRGVFVDRLTRVMGDIGDPVGQAGEALRNAWTTAEVLPGGL
jgi:hypothetical protein